MVEDVEKNWHGGDLAMEMRGYGIKETEWVVRIRANACRFIKCKGPSWNTMNPPNYPRQQIPY